MQMSSVTGNSGTVGSLDRKSANSCGNLTRILTNTSLILPSWPERVTHVLNIGCYLPRLDDIPDE